MSNDSFFTRELERSLQENAFAIKSSEILPVESSVQAAAKIVLLEDKDLVIDLDNDGFRVSLRMYRGQCLDQADMSR